MDIIKINQYQQIQTTNEKPYSLNIGNRIFKILCFFTDELYEPTYIV